MYLFTKLVTMQIWIAFLIKDMCNAAFEFGQNVAS